MTYAAVLDALMDGLPITRKAWLEDDESRIVYFDLETNSFVDRRTAEAWEVVCKFPCFTYTDMDADDWEVCEWDDNATL
jgi:hypothetical protein